MPDTSPPSVRTLLVRTAAASCDLAAESAVAEAWDRPSALAGFSVRGLTGHLVAGGTSVVARYLDAPVAEGTPVDAPDYFLTLLPDDLDDDLHRGVRERGEAAGADGPVALVAHSRQVLEIVAARLAELPAGHRVQVAGGLVLDLDDYLVTRLVELVVHLDDLAVSVGLPTPAVDPAAADLAVSCLVTMARRRHGDPAVVRALTRRERDDVQALRVL